MPSITGTDEFRITDSFEDGLIPVATPVDIDVPSSMPPCFVGITLYDAEGAVVSSGATGSFTIQRLTHVSEVWQEAGSIDVANYSDVDWLAPTRKIRVSPSSITGATSYRVRIAQYAAN